jgi:hypothetical protein
MTPFGQSILKTLPGPWGSSAFPIAASLEYFGVIQ